MLNLVIYDPSFTWPSIWNSKTVLNKDCRWKIGTDHNIDVWGDPWLRDENNFFICTPVDPELNGMKVNELIIPGSVI